MIQGDFNVVIVDWRGGSRRANYNLSASTTRTAGAWLGEVYYLHLLSYTTVIIQPYFSVQQQFTIIQLVPPTTSY